MSAEPQRGPLAGIRVVDLTRVLAGPYCTMLLAELGARVVKVERPDGGDDSRAIGPFIAGRSAYFMSLNRGKKSIALDLKDESDRALFDRLLEGADVLVENFRPGTLERLGYPWDALRARHPRLILASVSGFGDGGPYRDRPAYDLVVQAMGGLMSLTGHPGSPPTRVGTSLGDLSAGLFATVGIAGALFERERTGRGTRIDVAMLDCQVALLENAIARLQATGRVPGPLGSAHPSIAPFEAYRASDGHLVIAAGNQALFAACCGALGAEALVDDARFVDNDARTAHRDALRIEFERRLGERNVASWLERLGAAGVPCGPIQDVAQVFADPQVAARNMIVHMQDEVAGDVAAPGNPIKSRDWPDPPTREPAPGLDADREQILRDLAADRD